MQARVARIRCETNTLHPVGSAARSVTSPRRAKTLEIAVVLASTASLDCIVPCDILPPPGPHSLLLATGSEVTSVTHIATRGRKTLVCYPQLRLWTQASSAQPSSASLRVAAMHLPRHTIESHAAAPLFEHASFCSPHIPVFRDRPPEDHASPNASGGSTSELAQPAVFACATLNGFLVAQSDPLKLAANRSWSSAQGGLSHAVPVSHCSLLLLVGGGRVPRFAPNKVILWDEAAEYTPSQPDPASHHVNSDDDDDDHSSSFPSRRASTIFSAGSEFDAYGRAPSAEFVNAQTPISSEPSSACPLSTADSTGSLSDLDHTQHRTGPAAGSPSRSAAEPRSSVDQSMLASSLGIGRLHSSYLSDNTDRDAQSSVRFSRDSPDLAASSHSHAIMASSANLADPFAEDEALPPHLSPERNASPDSFTPGSHTGPHADPCTSESAASSRQFRPASAAHRDRADGLGLIDSVSSMATTDTHATAKRPPRVLRGREVAELEFSEAVRGVYATTIHTTRPRSHRPAGKGKARATSGAASSLDREDEPRFCVVLVVLLATRAIVFELSPPSTAPMLGGRPTSSAWSISKRAVAQTHKNPKGLGSVAPLYLHTPPGTVSQPSAVVALPGRQKGHVQLLYIQLGITHVDPYRPASVPAPPVGASTIIVAHEASLAALALSPDGRLLATASSKGTLIRIWSHNIGQSDGTSSRNSRASPHEPKSSGPGRTGVGATLARELRRGTDPATILSIAFAPDASIVAAASDKGTIHIFLLSQPGSMASTDDTTELPRSQASSTSRAPSLGRVAASYLPAGLGNLAGQIPPSVLPQYLKSEWSSAQFRIPLKTFGSASRHSSASAQGDESGIYGSNTPRSITLGTEKSTEGAWAQMRSRISDIRKGEASVDEKMFLCWVEEAASSPVTVTKGKASAQPSSRSEHASRPRPLHTSKDFHDGSKPESPYRFHLVVLTTSGGWYKLAIHPPKSNASEDASGSTVLDMYRRESKRATDKPKPLECQLLEFRPMVAMLDGWRA
ncbi:uncharacterized conserved protein [Moesziomyces antarcticus T-34]|uniref:Uncharacterized conserved protein n=1 Tax=Pseudozyma antarctica (strain T-34) TaxID=1151754 RepID=M9LRH8_PSEA3|nr:uncharacterized conserved protein [Moesziomyces antarcticus T-34]